MKKIIVAIEIIIIIFLILYIMQAFHVDRDVASLGNDYVTPPQDIPNFNSSTNSSTGIAPIATP